MSRDEKLNDWEQIEAAQATLLADPEIAAEYARASVAWNFAVGRATQAEGSVAASVDQCVDHSRVNRQSA